MSKFEQQMRGYLPLFQSALVTEIGDWAVKGFIDIQRNIYSISSDTKVISKLIELMLFPLFHSFVQLSKLHPAINHSGRAFCSPQSQRRRQNRLEFISVQLKRIAFHAA